ncbi:MAG: hypothetical protein H6990_10110 [Pseudomonadales bacterium]|nr:hypothetical protein [Halieaceae bacterium]MCP5165397.1 hypothetical protein [Pseudomonadales bacterium]
MSGLRGGVACAPQTGHITGPALLEKVVRRPALVVRATGIKLVAAGIVMLLHAAGSRSG